jgi:peptide/nickel transport system ATP-binding protein
MNPQQDNNLLVIKNLKMYFPIQKGLLRRKVGDIKAVDDISFDIKKNETLGLVGESGCGKTTTGRCILRLYQPTSGSIIFNGMDISSIPEKQVRPLRSHMGAIFQDPYGSLNPRQTARTIAGMPLIIHGMADRKDLSDKVSELFNLVGLDSSMMTVFLMNSAVVNGNVWA